jgi:hypothetical protein
MYLERKQQE